MKKSLILLSLFILLLIVGFTALTAFRQEKAIAAPEVFQSGISGGCYIAEPDVCKIHVDPFTINVDDGAGEKLVEFQLRANDAIIYEFKTDESTLYRPEGDYQPSLVTQDFAASCGETYEIKLLARDEGDTVLNIVATTGQFTCPVSVP
jgi:hypothetical protein